MAKRQQKFQRPKFTVDESFLGVTVVKMNDAMRELLSQFIDDVNDVEPEILALSKALIDPVKSRELRDEKNRRNHRRNRQVFDEEEAVA